MAKTKTMSVAEPGSFRDPSGQIFYVGERVLRTINKRAAADYEFVRNTGLLERLVDEKKLISSTEICREILETERNEDVQYVLEHPRLPFISYPYEWTFPALKAAALLHLDIHLDALDAGVTLSDASAYNVQFMGVQPIFIDLLSFRRYQQGEFWVGHRQFCEQFLNPILLRSELGVSHNAWYRGTQEGITSQEINHLLPWTKKLSRNVLTHVVIQSAFQSSTKSSLARIAVKDAAFPLAAFRKMLNGLRDWLERLEPADTGKTVWQDYETSHSYKIAELEEKKKFVAEFGAKVRPNIAWDIGCNTGEFSDVLLNNGARYVVGFDFDQGALEVAFARARSKRLMFQPTFFDAANPSPNQGWKEGERRGFVARANCDAILALALIHHLVIGKNVPIGDTVEWLVGLAPQGLIEFIPKNDPMVQELLALREDIFVDYTEECFIECLSRFSKIIDFQTITQHGRKIFWYSRN